MDVNLKKITTDQAKDTGLAVILILLIVTVMRHDTTYVIPAIIVLIVTMTIPSLFKPMAVLWFGLSHVMGEIVSRIILTVVFFLVVTPVALLRRVATKDSMGLKNWKAGTCSVFLDRKHQFKAKDLEKPF